MTLVKPWFFDTKEIIIGPPPGHGGDIPGRGGGSRGRGGGWTGRGGGGGWGPGGSGGGGGGGGGVDFGTEPNWGNVLFQMNFLNLTTADLASPVVDETGRHTVTFHADSVITAEGFLYNPNAPAFEIDTPDGAFNNDGDGNRVEGQAVVMWKRPSGVTGGVFYWGYFGGNRGWAIQHDGILYANASGGGSVTDLQNSSATPTDILMLTDFNDGAGEVMSYYYEDADGNTFNDDSFAENVLPINPPQSIRVLSGQTVRAIRILRGARNSNFADMLSKGGFPGAP